MHSVSRAGLQNQNGPPGATDEMTLEVKLEEPGNEPFSGSTKTAVEAMGGLRIIEECELELKDRHEKVVVVHGSLSWKLAEENAA